jgi:hypothetical protein
MKMKNEDMEEFKLMIRELSVQLREVELRLKEEQMAQLQFIRELQNEKVVFENTVHIGMFGLSRRIESIDEFLGRKSIDDEEDGDDVIVHSMMHG